MATPYIMPLGFIERTTEDGGTFTLTNPKESVSLRLNTPVAVWRYSPGQLALAKIRGVICAVGYITATFRTVESQIDSRWPDNEQLLRDRTQVYLALENSFEPDPARMLTREQADAMQNIASEYRKLRSGDPKERAARDGPEQDT